MNSSQQKAWIIFAEAFGEGAVRAVKPSSLADRQVRTAENVVNALIEAYQAENTTKTLSKLLKFKRPGFLSVGGAASGASRWKAHRKHTLTEGTLPFQDSEFYEWMQSPSYPRGLRLRLFLPDAISDGSGNDDFPPNFDFSLANKKVSGDINSASFISILVHGATGL
jgi:hypothetical protein